MWSHPDGSDALHQFSKAFPVRIAIVLAPLHEGIDVGHSGSEVELIDRLLDGLPLAAPYSGQAGAGA